MTQSGTKPTLKGPRRWFRGGISALLAAAVALGLGLAGAQARAWGAASGTAQISAAPAGGETTERIGIITQGTDVVVVRLDPLAGAGVGGQVALYSTPAGAARLLLELTGLTPGESYAVQLHAGTALLPSASFTEVATLTADTSGRAVRGGSVRFRGAEDVALANITDGDHLIAVLHAGDIVAAGQIPARGGKVPSAGITVTKDRASYRPGETITATISNAGTAAIWGGGGYRCGLVGVEVGLSGVPGWAPAPGGAQICPAIALSALPGQTRTETLTLDAPGAYRLVLRVSPEGGEPVIVYSEPFTVDF